MNVISVSKKKGPINTMSFFSSIFDRSPRIETERLILRRMKVSDAADMFEYARLPEVTKYLLWAPHESIDYTSLYLRQVEKGYKDGDFFDFGIILKENKKFIGTCGFARLDIPNATGEIGYVINPKYQRQGIAPEAASAIVRLGFEYYNLNRIEARYMVKNTPSRKVMEKCGMQFEGIFRNLMFVKYSYEDIGVCSVLRSEYNAPKDSYQKFTNI